MPVRMAVRQAMAWHRPLMWLSVAMAGLLVCSIGGMIFDNRILTGAPIWAKPAKFCISILLYAPTWAWMFSYQRRARRWGWWAGTLITVGLGGEMVLIGLQVVRGTRSHFNYSTPFDSAVFTGMTVLIVTLFAGHVLLSGLLLFERRADKAATSAVRSGVIISTIGAGLATLMTKPTTAQLASMRAGAPTTIIGAHTVGLPDGGPGLPLLGWSTVGGDLRIPHFVGLHGLQALPLLAIALTMLGARWPRLRDEFVRRSLVRIGALGYLGLTGLVTWQALRGQSIVRPDGRTLAVLAGLVVAVLALAVLALRAKPVPTRQEVVVS